MIRDVCRGDIFYYTPFSIDHVQRFKRPAVVVSNDKGNKYSPNVILCTICGEREKEFVAHVHVRPNKDNGLYKDSVVQCEMIFTVSKNELSDYIGHMDEETMSKIDEALGISVGVLI